MITNTDGTVGNVINGNKFITESNNLMRYRLLESMSKDTSIQRYKKTKKASEPFEPSGKHDYGVRNFINKMQNFYFNPPSDNLWTIQIKSMDNNSDLETLYSSIIQVNTQGYPKMKEIVINKDVNLSFISGFSEKSGVFLAQDVQFSPLSVNILDKPWGEGSSQHHGFLNFGNVSLGRQDSKSLKISFLISNWDIGDILFEPWIAAVAQKGLIEDGISSSIKSKIIITEFSSSVPQNYNNQSNTSSEMVERKQYIFNNCVPVSRGEISKNYEMENAGTFKKSIVDFRYDFYEIKYLI